MKFFDRTEETASLAEIRSMAKSNAQFTVVTGRLSYKGLSLDDL